jgi:hypothetical protein
MPNFAQECPLLLFLPFIILAAVAIIGGTIHLIVRLEPQISARRAAARVAARVASGTAPVELPALVVSLEQQLSLQLQTSKARFRPVT